MNIQIYGGINQIGGNKIFVNVGERCFLFDFGLSFTDNKEYFGDFLQPRRLNGILDYLYLNLIPPVNSIYREDCVRPPRFANVLSKYSISPQSETKLDGFFLTHPHLDHYRFMGFLRQDTPMYINSLSQAILNYIDQTSNASYTKNLLNFYRRFHTVPYRTKNGMKRARRLSDYDDLDTNRPINILEPQDTVEFKNKRGSIEIGSYAVDHSIPGSSAYILEYDGVSMVYTGDLRKHGKHSEWVDEFISKATASNPVVIITEGTNIPDIESYNAGNYKNAQKSERYVEDESLNEIKQHEGLVFVDFPVRNLDRIITYTNLAKKTDRIFAVPPKLHRYVAELRDYAENLDEKHKESFLKAYDLPEPNGTYMKPYLRRKRWGLFEAQDYHSYSRDVFNSEDFLTFKDIQDDPSRYLVYLNFYMLPEIIDIDPDPGSTLFINSTTDPFDKEMEIQEERMEAWLNRFNIEKTKTIHSSGHCSTDDLVKLLGQINADKVIPVHTENMDTFPHLGLSSEIIHVQIGQKIGF